MKCIRLIEPNVDENVILQSLLNTPKKKEVMIFHFDITSSVIMSYKLMLSWVIHTLFSHNIKTTCLILLALTCQGMVIRLWGYPALSGTRMFVVDLLGPVYLWVRPPWVVHVLNWELGYSTP